MPDYYLDKSGGDEEELEFHPRDYLLILKKRKGIIFVVCIICICVAIIRNHTAVPYYTASSQVMIEKNRPTGELNFGNYYPYDPDFLETQSALIKSVNVGRRVVENLDLTGRYRHYFFTDSRAESSAVDASQTSFFASIKKSVLQILKSTSSFLSSGDKIDEAGSGSVEKKEKIARKELTEKDIVARRISGGLRVEQVGDTRIVSISYRSKNQAVAQVIANAVVEAYMDEMLEIKLSSATHSLKWMTDKAEQEREKLERSERALQQYMRTNDLVTVQDSLSIYPQKMSEFSSQLSSAEAERKELEDLLEQIDATGNAILKIEKIPLFADNNVLKANREEIYKARQKIKELSKKYGPKHPVMIKANEDVKLLQEEKRFEVERINAATRNSYELASSREDNLKELLAETKSKVLNLNEKYIQYSILKREVDSNRVLYDALQSSMKRESITDQAQTVNIWVVKEADFPGGPSSPNKQRTLMMGILLGLFGGIGLAFLVEYLDNTIKTEEELERRYGKTVLGSVEKMGKKADKVESYIVDQPLSALAESYRLIRSGLLLSSAERPPKTILVTSMGKGEGKTSTVINLARVLVQDDRKVLIIDGDLRRPRMHRLVNFEIEGGLTSYLTGNSDVVPIQVVPKENLDLITSGPIPPNPAELLCSKKMQELLMTVQDEYDFVLLDSAPVQSVTDSLALSVIVEGTIIVVQYGKTTYEMMHGGLKKLSDVNSNILGFVLNGLKRSEAGSYYYYGYSGYYSKDDYYKNK